MTLVANMKGFLGFNTRQRHELRGSLNLVAAAEAHVLWKTRLGHHVHGSIRESLESALVGQDGICQLGNWISGPAFKPLRGSDAYQQLYDAHRQFHQMGALIIEKLRASDHSGAEKVFANEYSQSLRHIIQALVEINKILQED